jgi:RNA polymerase sigma-70 factor, ECF subfamily
MIPSMLECYKVSPNEVGGTVNPINIRSETAAGQKTPHSKIHVHQPHSEVKKCLPPVVESHERCFRRANPPAGGSIESPPPSDDFLPLRSEPYSMYYHFIALCTVRWLYWPSPEADVEFYAFDSAYYQRLRTGDPETERHFVSYFSDLILIKLRSRLLPADTIKEIQQETFARVLVTLRKNGGLEKPERLGPFVNSVCNNVMREFFRSNSRHDQLDGSFIDPPDRRADLDSALVSAEAKKHVQRVLDQLSERDREVLREVFLEDEVGDRDQLCRRLGIERDYLRVLLHRAKKNFKSLYVSMMAETAQKQKMG